MLNASRAMGVRMSTRILTIFGTRPEAIKLFPLVHALEADPRFDGRVCVSGQHRGMLDQVLQISGVVPHHDLDLMQPDQSGFVGLENFEFFVTDPSFTTSVINTVLLLGSVIGITVLLGVAIALLINEPFAGRGLVRVLLISPFFVMPTVNALMWKNMMMNPIYGVLAQVWAFFGAAPVDWLTDFPLLSVIIMISWQWLPFATLIFMTALQSMDREQLEAARMDGANYLQQLRYLYLPTWADRWPWW